MCGLFSTEDFLIAEHDGECQEECCAPCQAYVTLLCLSHSGSHSLASRRTMNTLHKKKLFVTLNQSATLTFHVLHNQEKRDNTD